MSPVTRLQLVVPCYNEAARLDGASFLQLVASRDDVDVLFVNDGSTDGTQNVLSDIAGKAGGRISAIQLPRNVGKAGGGATRSPSCVRQAARVCRLLGCGPVHAACSREGFPRSYSMPTHRLRS